VEPAFTASASKNIHRWRAIRAIRSISIVNGTTASSATSWTTNPHLHDHVCAP
jgi:hypothetical protein